MATHKSKNQPNTQNSSTTTAGIKIGRYLMTPLAHDHTRRVKYLGQKQNNTHSSLVDNNSARQQTKTAQNKNNINERGNNTSTVSLPVYYTEPPDTTSSVRCGKIRHKKKKTSQGPSPPQALFFSVRFFPRPSHSSHRHVRYLLN